MSKYFKGALTIFGFSYYIHASVQSDKSKSKCRNRAYQYGQIVSLKHKNNSYWDNFIEPFIIKQFGFFFGIGHSFIKGMISDNDINIDHKLDEEIKNIIENIDD